MPDRDELRKSYDRIASDYAAEYADEMAKKDFDRRMLDWLAEKSAGRGPICDLGCGPGQAAGYLLSRGAPVCGIDLSAKRAERTHRGNQRGSTSLVVRGERAEPMMSPRSFTGMSSATPAPIVAA